MAMDGCLATVAGHKHPRAPPSLKRNSLHPDANRVSVCAWRCCTAGRASPVVTKTTSSEVPRFWLRARARAALSANSA